MPVRIKGEIMSDLYQELAKPFDQVQTRRGGNGMELSYLTGEQVVSRLNDALGVDGWSFRIIEHGIRQDADEIWVKGELAAEIDGKTVVRQQFGSQKVARPRDQTEGRPIDIGFDLKGATTDCMKKCAAWLGVGLYLSQAKPPVNNYRR